MIKAALLIAVAATQTSHKLAAVISVGAARDNGSGNTECLFTSETRNEVSGMSPSAVHHPASKKGLLPCAGKMHRLTTRLKMINQEQNLDNLVWLQTRPQLQCSTFTSVSILLADSVSKDAEVEVKLRQKNHKGSCASYKKYLPMFLNIHTTCCLQGKKKPVQFVQEQRSPQNSCENQNIWLWCSHPIKRWSLSFLPPITACFWEDTFHRVINILLYGYWNLSLPWRSER